MKHSTIFALSSGFGRTGISVYRLSGPDSGYALINLSKRILPKARYASRRILYDEFGNKIDDGLVIWFPKPHSFTGEDVVELHLHGGIAVASAITDALLKLNLEPADPGEFSRRAFLAGKFDLIQAEAISDLINAETTTQRLQALRQMDGALTKIYNNWRNQLLQCQAYLEAEIDFSNEDLPNKINDQVMLNLNNLVDEISSHLNDNNCGERLREGLSVTIVGAPNVGKSSLLNRIAKRDIAIVSSLAGTTRDVIEVHLNLSGYPVILADTAGLHESTETIEKEGVRKTYEYAKSADLKLIIFNAQTLEEPNTDSLALIDDRALIVVNKCDCQTKSLPNKIRDRSFLVVSAKTGIGIDSLISELTNQVTLLLKKDDVPMITRVRHRNALQKTEIAIRRALQAPFIELVAEDIRLASRNLGKITGKIEVEEMLDVIFNEFCIGK
ncbi:MAG: tRNA uridine-5-carboxymethylaminomethyl(34) synthesis GTPase MnmE [Rhodospirillaceae bacterium]|jgi:tRNA modification GTPase|nr:tRNA uridine-5-carboxymethylaminomethyl(34) synthesis GTPase MnmE [Rhodospirillaceae bacterium]